MITEQTADIAIATALALEKTNIALTPGSYNNSTPTEVKLLATISKLQDVGSMDEHGYFPTAIKLADATSGIGGPHTGKLTEIGNSISMFLAGQISFAKNTAVPLATNLMKDLDSLIKKYPMEVKYTPEVGYYSLPKILFVQGIHDAIVRSASIGYKEITTFPIGPQKTKDELVDYLRSGNAGIDGPLVEYILSLPDEVIVNCWDTVFNKDFQPKVLTDGDIVYNGSQLPFLILTLFFTHKLAVDLPDSSPVSADVYRSTLNAIESQCSYRLSCILEAYTNQLKLGHLIITYTKEFVTVNKDVYNDWINAGGNNAILFGAILTERPETFVDGLNRRSNEYIETWNKHNLMLSSISKNNREGAVRQGLSEIVDGYIRENASDWYANIAPMGVVTLDHPKVAEIIKGLRKYINNLTIGDMENPRKIATTIVGDYLLSTHSAGAFLNGIDEAMLINKGIGVKEASNLATIDYICGWLANQMDIIELQPLT